jgi:hypothetical protein
MQTAKQQPRCSMSHPDLRTMPTAGKDGESAIVGRYLLGHEASK